MVGVKKIQYLEYLLYIYERRRLEGSPPAVIESPSPADGEADRRGLPEDFTDLLPCGVVDGEDHQPIGVKPIDKEGLVVNHKLSSLPLHHTPVLLHVIPCMGPMVSTKMLEPNI